MVRVLLTALIAAAMLTTPAYAETNAVDPYTVPNGTGFTRPPDAGGSTAESLAWNRIVDGLVDATPAGETITASLFSLTSIDSQQAIRRADVRGVKVRLALYDARADDSNVMGMVRELNDGSTPGSWAKVCKGSCYGPTSGDPGVQHFKGFAFSKVMETSTRSVAKVTTMGSGNLTNGGSGWNNFQTTRSTAIYDRVVPYVTGMRADRSSRPSTARTVTASPYKLYLYPQARTTPDVVYDTLKHTTCKAPAGYGNAGRTVVRVQMFAWTNNRDIEDQLVRLRRAGCDVGVVVSAPTVDTSVMSYLVRGGVPLWNGHQVKGSSFYYPHGKYLVVDGPIAGTPRHRVLTGSNNWTDGGLTRNTESVIRIDDNSTADAFRGNWSLVKGYSERVTSTSALSAQSTVPLDPDNMEGKPNE